MNDSNIPSRILLLIALAQGFALILLNHLTELNHSPQWLVAFYSVAFFTPTMLLLSVSKNSASTYKWTAAYSIIIFILGYYIGSQLASLSSIKSASLLCIFAITLSIATFKSLMYIQHFATGESLSYSRLYVLSWRNFLILALSLLFMLSTAAVLMLWAALFLIINIEFFYRIFIEPWFYYPILALANGLGVIIFRQQSNIIDTTTRIQQTLMKFLLVILVFVSILFLAALLFTGLEPLWRMGGSTLILVIQALMLFFVNAVYQNNSGKQPYNIGMHRFIYIGFLLLPIYSIISFYGLSLRVEQYGWSVFRCWAFLLWALLTAFSVGYLYGIIRLKDDWLNQLGWVNVRMGLVVLVVMLAVNSPLLDFRKITVTNQINRLENGAVSLEDFDYDYLRDDLGKPGYNALQKIKSDIKVSHPEIKLNIAAAPTSGDKPQKTTNEKFLLLVKGIDNETPTKLTNTIYNDLKNNLLLVSKRLQLLKVDLNDDGKTEYIIVIARKHHLNIILYYQLDDEWLHLDFENIQSNTGRIARTKHVLNALQSNNYKAAEPEWNYLQIGDQKYRVKK